MFLVAQFCVCVSDQFLSFLSSSSFFKASFITYPKIFDFKISNATNDSVHVAGLRKAKQYDWKDSNLALFGSDTERQVKSKH